MEIHTQIQNTKLCQGKTFYEEHSCMFWEIDEKAENFSRTHRELRVWDIQWLLFVWETLAMMVASTSGGVSVCPRNTAVYSSPLTDPTSSSSIFGPKLLWIACSSSSSVERWEETGMGRRVAGERCRPPLHWRTVTTSKQYQNTEFFLQNTEYLFDNLKTQNVFDKFTTYNIF